MSPRIKKSRAELPKIALQKGMVGAYPIQAWSVSALFQQKCDCLIGFRDAEETLHVKSRSQVQLTFSTKKKPETVDLIGKVFNGCSDALYRGRLPEVMLTNLSDASCLDFLNDIADYLEQLVAMGFFVSRPGQPQANPVMQYIPCFLLMGQGLWYSRMMASLTGFLKDLARQYPVLTDTVQGNILGRFVRGIPVPEVFSEPVVGFVMPLVEIAECYKIAGGNEQSQDAIINALSLYGLLAALETQSDNATERLEFESAYSRLIRVALPKASTKQLQSGILSLGRKRNAFLTGETPEAFKIKTVSPKPMETPGQTELQLLQDLRQYARMMRLDAEEQVFSNLVEKLQNKL